MGLITGCASSARDSGTAEDQSAAVAPGPLMDSISTVGSVRARSDATPAFEVAGQVSPVPVQEGQQVRAGDALVRLDDAGLDLQVGSAQAALAVARACLDQLQAGLQQPQIYAAAPAAGDQVVVSSGSSSDRLRDMISGLLLGGGGE